MAGIVLASAFAGDAERLAGVSAAEDVDGGEACVQFAHVGEALDSGEPLGEDFAASWVVLAHPGVVASDCEVEAADPGEE